ncbi:Hypothetical predicted protein [Paramuricea clavata]|uniref:Uncharacterized protein n=1 Tax=Paramuricea clavata TaxID=317549 RepID=A0A7D9DQF4_PARCT|nr:Hypothetical predicted protein [Paramuricea clavata]
MKYLLSLLLSRRANRAECIPYSENGKGTRDGKSAEFVQPAGILVVDCSTGCLRMISEVPPLVRLLSSHLKKQIPTPFTIDAAITRIEEVYDFDCQCIHRTSQSLP